jgi:hypothetical protein
MAEFALVFIIFIAVMVITVLVFGGWVMVNIVRGFGRLLNSGNRFPPSPRPFDVRLPRYGSIQCSAPGCRHMSPTSARFCRHCGRALPMNSASTLGDQFHA